jgi:hypothetical protein
MRFLHRLFSRPGAREAPGWFETLTMILCLAAGPSLVLAHDGPPFPIVSGRTIGPYIISVWTDPDATDDGSPGGQFWVVIDRADRSGRPPEDTRATVSVRPLDRGGPAETAAATPVRGNVSNQFAALVLDHEGRFAVHVTVDGTLGAAEVEAEVDATYDLRPPPYMLAWYLAPFLLAGFLWARLILLRYRASGTRPVADSSDQAAGRGRTGARDRRSEGRQL